MGESRAARAVGWLAHLAAVGVIGWVDYAVGPDIQLSVVYIVPIVTAALWLGREAALLVAFAGAAAWFFNAELVRPTSYGLGVVLWNGVSRLAIYLVLAIVVDRIRRNQLELRKLNRMREEFLTLVAHELRQPAAAMALTTASLADSPSVRPEERRLLLGLQRQARGLARLAAQLLAIGRVESGELELNTARLDLRDLVREAAREAAEPDRVEIHLPSSPLLVEADPERIRQAIDNLVSNALKFSPPSTPVTLRASNRASRAHVEVIDRGAGFSAEEMALLFRKYGRVRSSRTAGIEGTGIGLYLTRLVVEAHGGQVTATSAGPGRGSTFSFGLPLLRADG